MHYEVVKKEDARNYMGMTGRQYMNILNDEELAIFVIREARDIGNRYTSSVDGFKKWLGEPYFNYNDYEVVEKGE